MDQLRRGGFCVVLAGDVPLLTVATLQRLLDEARRSEAAAIILTCVVEDGGGLRSDHQG